jgi:lysyl-tRNA synthetase class 2
VIRALRSFFEGRGYLEVETPQLVPSPGLELHLRPILAGGGYLNTSPEYQMKRLLAGGLERIFQIGHAFRDEERGQHHVREFTMLEWYRVGADLPDLMEETEALVAAVALAASGASRVRGADGAFLDLAPPWDRIGVAEACARFAGVECTGQEDGPTLARRAREAGWPIPADLTDWDEVFTRLFVEAVEPHLGRERPTLLHRWPARCAALARLDPGDPTVALRFEVFAGGVELANAFCELTDPVEQRVRLEEDLAERRARGLAAPPLDERFLAALEEGIPPTSGIALGVDRLAMLIAGVSRIDDVLTFTTEEL